MRIGIDLGGTKIEAMLMDDAGREYARKRIPSPRGDYAGTIAAINGLTREMDEIAGCTCPVGIGIPGAISPATGLIKNANSTWLIGKPLDRDLEAALGREVRLANDADCFALSEASDGAGKGCASVFGVILGTGVGGGIVINGRLLSGPNAIAGEWGHTPLPWPDKSEAEGPACYCGLKGCVETWLSGPGLAADHTRATGQMLAGETIVARAKNGDATARTTLDRHADRLARALAVVINIIDPEIIVLGGGLSEMDHLYEQVPQRWGRYVFSDTVATKLARNHHGGSGGVRGAAWLWPAGSRA